MIAGKLTAKGQTTVPLAVRRALGLKEGDSLAWVFEEGRAVLTRVVSAETDDPFATFEEWAGEADSRVYADL